MKRTMTWPLVAAAVLMATAVSAVSVEAAPITYLYSATASGSLGGSPFVSQLVTIRAIGDTTRVVTQPLSNTFFNDTLGTVTVAGIGSGTFTNATAAVANQNFSQVGFSDLDRNLAILFSRGNPAYATYDLTTAIGPLTGASLFSLESAFPTTAGDFILDTVGTVTFQATLIPLPSTITLASMCGLGLMVLVFRKRRAVPSTSS